MKILVTGGSGHIGASLCQALDQAGHEVINWNYRHGQKDKNLEQLDLLLEGIDMVIHTLALTSSFGPKNIYEEINIDLTRKVLALAIKRDVGSFLYLSDARLDWIDPNISSYFYTKDYAEKFILKVAQIQKIKTLSLRLPLVMGIASKSKWQQEIIAKTHKNSLCLIGNGDNKRDVMYIDDVVKGILTALNLLHQSHEHNGKCYRLSGDKKMTWEEILTLNLKMIGVSEAPRFISPMRAKFLAIFYEKLYLFFGVYHPLPVLTRSFYEESLHDDSENHGCTSLLPQFKCQTNPDALRALVAHHRAKVDQIFKAT